MKSRIASAKETVQHKINTSLRMYINKMHSDYPPHWHTDIEIIWPKEAPYKIICESKTYNVEVGDILLICPSVLHEIFSLSPGSRIYIQADFSRFTALKEIDKAFRLMSPALHIKKKTCPRDIYDQLCEWLIKIMNINFGSDPSLDMHYDDYDESLMAYTELAPYGELEIYSILMQFIALCGKNINLIKDSDSIATSSAFKNSISLSNVCTYLSENFTEDISLESVAAFAGFSKYHFERIFTEYTGMTFYQYLQKMRINYAQTLLSNPELSITDISYQAGFASSTAFTRAFKKTTGYPPSKFRMLNEEQHPLSVNRHFANFRPENSKDRVLK
ncbi:AraC family transcriptional regulator [Butyrivibrio sp. XB500-5]|uniref:AraC family transcriptional regulator n=1 Tax=Butyrivibrio sp. XB500-5 TaxID=2364880 RepID=UPI000EA8F06C|nr:AraC family transcriptional regulator [Butyrivibrio sp. XB500-5]RKM62554.1 AraC family transcriptional regulator [Butyrivibrio sp. XB500-5]